MASPSVVLIKQREENHWTVFYSLSGCSYILQSGIWWDSQSNDSPLKLCHASLSTPGVSLSLNISQREEIPGVSVGTINICRVLGRSVAKLISLSIIISPWRKWSEAEIYNLGDHLQTGGTGQGALPLKMIQVLCLRKTSDRLRHINKGMRINLELFYTS